jgi:hypothetical protein
MLKSVHLYDTVHCAGHMTQEFQQSPSQAGLVKANSIIHLGSITLIVVMEYTVGESLARFSNLVYRRPLTFGRLNLPCWRFLEPRTECHIPTLWVRDSLAFERVVSGLLRTTKQK